MRTIKILSAGPIRTMGMIHGPILTPYTVDENRLISLIREGLDIVEIMPDKSEKKLTLSDINSVVEKPSKKTTNVKTSVDDEVSSDKNNDDITVEESPTNEDITEEEQKITNKKNKHKK